MARILFSMQIDSFLRFLCDCAKLGYAGHLATVTDMLSEADNMLFRKILYNKARVLHTYLPDRLEIVYSLQKDCYWLFYHSAVLYIFVYVFYLQVTSNFLRPISLICYHSCICQLVLLKKLDDDDDDEFHVDDTARVVMLLQYHDHDNHVPLVFNREWWKSWQNCSLDVRADVSTAGCGHW